MKMPFRSFLRCEYQLLAALAFTGTGALLAQTPPVLVRDLNTAPNPWVASSSPSSGLELSGVAYFVAYSAGSGSELWRSDGTAAGTRLVRETVSGFADGQEWYRPRSLLRFGTGIVFTGCDWAYGRELWRSDGTYAGTRMVADIDPGADSGVGGLFGGNELCSFGGHVYFGGFDEAHGFELWRWDGLAPQPTIFFEFAPGPIGGSPRFFEVVGNRLFFTATTAGADWLWVTDGTVPGTQPLQAVQARGGKALGNLLVFVAEAGFPAPWFVWRSDGTPGGTYPLGQIGSAATGFVPSDLTVAGNGAFWVVDNGFLGRQLWHTDGSTAPAFVVAVGSWSEGPVTLQAMGGLLYFTTSHASVGPGLWRSNGSATGTTIVQPFAPGSRIVGTLGSDLVVSAATTGSPGLWRSNGTVAGTTFVHPVDPVAAVAQLGSALLFAGNDAVTGTELWRTDGTAAGTSLVKDIHVTTSDARPNGLLGTPSNTRVFFAADDGVNARGLFASEGSAATTQRIVGPSLPTFAPWEAEPLAAFLGPTLLFAGEDPVFGYELWRSDGTAAGTSLVRDIHATGGAFWNTSYWDRFVALGSNVLFAADDGVTGRQVWRSDGSATGTTRITSLPHSVLALTRAGDRVFFGTLGGLFVTDGNMVASIAQVQMADPWENCAVGGRLFFPGDDGVHGRELWASDGTVAGTYMVTDLTPGPSSSSGLRDFTAVGDILYFTFSTAATGRELWRSDGTAAGTVMVTDIVPGSVGSEPWHLAALGNRLLFFASDGSSGLEPWRSDGTAATTVQIADINLGLPSSDAPDFGGFRTIPGAARALFPASDGSSGMELWATDGNVVVRLSDIWPGLQGALAAEEGRFALAGGRLYFGANDGAQGRELYSLPMFFSAATTYGDGCVGSSGRLRLASSGPPQLGTAIQLEVVRAPATTLGVLGADYAPGYLLLATDCRLLLANPTSVALLATSGAGTSALPMSLPANPALIQARVYFQVAVVDAAGPVLGLNLSNGLELTVDFP